MNRIFRMLTACLVSVSAAAFWSGAVAVCCLFSAVAPVRILLGHGGVADAGLLATAALCVCLFRTCRIGSAIGKTLGSFCLIMAAGWCLVTPFLLSQLMAQLSSVPLTALESPLIRYVISFGVTCLSIAPCLLLLGVDYSRQGQQNLTARRFWLLGAAFACPIVLFCILPGVGATALAGCGIVLAGGLVVRERFLSGTVSAADIILLPRTEPSARVMTTSLLNLLTGMAMPVVLAILSQLIPRGLLTDGLLLAGILVGLAITQRRSASPTGSCRTWLLFAVWMSGLTAGYPVLTRLCLWMNSQVSSLPLLLIGRGLLVMSLSLPAGYFLRQASSVVHRDRLRQPFLILAGFLLGASLPFVPGRLALVLGCGAMGMAALQFLNQRSVMLSNRWGAGRLAGLGACCVVGLCLSGNANPRLSEKVLFSSQSLQMARQGVGLGKITWFDDGRLVTSFESMQGRVSVWKHRGAQLMFRQNGISTGMFSTSGTDVPQSASDLLPALLPLAFHPAPQDVLVLSIDPSVLKTCHSYPLRLVRTLDGNAESHRMLQWLNRDVAQWSLDGGATFQFGQMDSQLALAANHGCRYDLVISPLIHPAVAGTASQTSQEFYRSVARQLNPHGLFSQRIPYYDLGPDAVKAVCKTLRSVFPEVMAVETIPGELVFLCSPDSLPVINEELANRFKSPQSRRLLGEAGWDWSMVFGRGGLTTESLDRFIGEDVPVLSCAEARWETKLSLEISRWGAKAESTRSELARFGQALSASLPEESITQEVNHRLEDLNLSYQLQLGHPNDPWGYRGAIKNRLQDRPRTALVHVNYEGLKRVLDPEDQRRKEYLKTLGDVIHAGALSPEGLETLKSYDAPFDPLITLFVHYEAIQLIDRSSSQDWESQYHSLLKTIYFASSQDQSVRNVAKAIDLLCREETIALSPAERWDHVNGLMQALTSRWQMRWQSGKASKYDAVDTEQSVQAVERAMTLLSDSAGDCGLTASDWQLRKECLEENLVRPLRQKRSSYLRTVSMAPDVKPSPETENSPEAENVTVP